MNLDGRYCGCVGKMWRCSAGNRVEEGGFRRERTESRCRDVAVWCGWHLRSTTPWKTVFRSPWPAVAVMDWTRLLDSVPQALCWLECWRWSGRFKTSSILCFVAVQEPCCPYDLFTEGARLSCESMEPQETMVEVALLCCVTVAMHKTQCRFRRKGLWDQQDDQIWCWIPQCLTQSSHSSKKYIYTYVCVWHRE